jgi:hypothetical protein
MAGAKTARKNTRTASTSKARPTAAGEVTFLISCNGGRNAYVRNLATGKNPNLATDSAAFDEAIQAIIDQGYGAKVADELDALAATNPVWADTRDRLAVRERLAA